jgi:hypothetical protein
MINISHSEASDLFSKWLSERSLLRVTMTSGFFTTVAFVRVEVLSAERITFLSDTTPPCESMLRFGFLLMGFGYSDFRDQAEDGVAPVEGALVAVCPYGRVIFEELKA